jgi:hypothetical protein
MPNIVFSLYDLIQIGLLLLACFACFKAGHKRGIEDTLEFMEEQGILESSQDA